MLLLTGMTGDHESKRKAQSVSPEKVGGLSRGEHRIDSLLLAKYTDARYRF